MKIKKLLNIKKEDFEKICKGGVSIANIVKEYKEDIICSYSVHINRRDDKYRLTFTSESYPRYDVEILESYFIYYVQKVAGYVLDNMLKQFGFSFYIDYNVEDSILEMILPTIVKEHYAADQDYMNDYIIKDFMYGENHRSEVLRDSIKSLYNHRLDIYDMIINSIKQKFDCYYTTRYFIRKENKSRDRIDELRVDFSSKKDLDWFSKMYNNFIITSFSNFCEKYAIETDVFNEHKTRNNIVITYSNIEKSIVYENKSIIFRISYKDIKTSNYNFTKYHDGDYLLELFNIDNIRENINISVYEKISSKSLFLESMIYDSFRQVYRNIYKIKSFNRFYKYSETKELFKELFMNTITASDLDESFIDRAEKEKFMKTYFEKIVCFIINNKWIFHGNFVLNYKENPISYYPEVVTRTLNDSFTRYPNKFDYVDINIPVISNDNKVLGWISNNKKTLITLIRYLVELYTHENMSDMKIDSMILNSGCISVKCSFL